MVVLGEAVVFGTLGGLPLVVGQHHLLFQRASICLVWAVAQYRMHGSNISWEYRCTCVCSAAATTKCNTNPQETVDL